MRRLSTGLCLMAICLVLTVACTQKMAVQPKYRPLEPSTFFADGQSARHLVPDTVPRGFVVSDTLLYTGRSGQTLADTFPFTVTMEILERGQERYGIFCAPCHGFAGQGDGMVVRRGFSPPPSFHIDRLRNAPPGHFFDVMTNGFGAMPSYAPQVPVRDRWAIIAYIRALQLSQHATVEDVPPDQRQQLETGAQTP
ncbi:MAG: cytochrome c [Ardenticatenaceae bacterium]|nr:cytochrome c [Ardenticatenaceae bacterium]HBY99034.1 quinol:cytochrome C oxidoreductase [Chloroflexota bacterium]